MPLFYVQDTDRPLYVIAKHYGEAEVMWTQQIAKENDIKYDDVEPPQGISHIADDDDFLGVNPLYDD